MQFIFKYCIFLFIKPGDLMSRLYGDKEYSVSEEVKNFFTDGVNRDLESDLSIVLFQYKENSEQRYIEKRNYSRNICLYN